jgi:hypothetical protein
LENSLATFPLSLTSLRSPSGMGENNFLNGYENSTRRKKKI